MYSLLYKVQFNVKTFILFSVNKYNILDLIRMIYNNLVIQSMADGLIMVHGKLITDYFQ